MAARRALELIGTSKAWLVIRDEISDLFHTVAQSFGFLVTNFVLQVYHQFQLKLEVLSGALTPCAKLNVY